MYGVPCDSQPTTILSSDHYSPGGVDRVSLPFADFQLEYKVLDRDADLARLSVLALVRPVQLTYDFVSVIYCEIACAHVYVIMFYVYHYI